MRLDLTPYRRSTIGFDRLFNLLDQATTNNDAAPGYPPYNIERSDENNYRVTIAVAVTTPMYTRTRRTDRSTSSPDPSG